MDTQTILKILLPFCHSENGFGHGYPIDCNNLYSFEEHEDDYIKLGITVSEDDSAIINNNCLMIELDEKEIWITCKSFGYYFKNNDNLTYTNNKMPSYITPQTIMLSAKSKGNKLVVKDVIIAVLNFCVDGTRSVDNMTFIHDNNVLHIELHIDNYST